MPALSNEADEVFAQRAQASLAPLGPCSVRTCSEQRDDIFRPDPELVPIARRQLKKLRNQHGGQGICEVADYIRRAPVLDSIDQLLHDLLDAGTQALHDRGRESLV